MVEPKKKKEQKTEYYVTKIAAFNRGPQSRICLPGEPSCFFFASKGWPLFLVV